MHDLVPDVCQRWRRGGRPVWVRPDRELFDPGRYGVRLIDDDTTVRGFVQDYHYSGSLPPTLVRVGVFDIKGTPAAPVTEPRLVGVAVITVPMRKSVVTNVYPHLEPNVQAAELGRFCLVDEVGYNAESHVLAEFRRLAWGLGFVALVAFSDPYARTTTDGLEVKRGHHGTIYKAGNAAEHGTSYPRTLRLLPDGRVLSDRTRQKIRKQESGHAAAELVLIKKYGAPVMRAGEHPAAWLARAESAIGVRRQRHLGNKRFLIKLAPTQRLRDRVEVKPLEDEA
jgi:hypothetical protein